MNFEEIMARELVNISKNVMENEANDIDVRFIASIPVIGLTIQDIMETIRNEPQLLEGFATAEDLKIVIAASKVLSRIKNELTNKEVQ